jgi:hypothetical protein
MGSREESCSAQGCIVLLVLTPLASGCRRARWERACAAGLVADPNLLLMDDTSLENTFTCQPQQRNMHGRIFGGFLMRCACSLLGVEGVGASRGYHGLALGLSWQCVLVCTTSSA